MRLHSILAVETEATFAANVGPSEEVLEQSEETRVTDSSDPLRGVL